MYYSLFKAFLTKIYSKYINLLCFLKYYVILIILKYLFHIKHFLKIQITTTFDSDFLCIHN